MPIILLDRNAYGDESAKSANEYIAEHCADVLAAGVDPNFVQSELSAEGVWQNYDTLKKYLPNLELETEFDNLVNDRVAIALRKVGDAPTGEARSQVYADVVNDILYGSDVYDYLERGGDEQLLEISHKTGDEETVKYAQQLLNWKKKNPPK